VAKRIGCGARLVQDAKKVKELRPDLIPQIAARQITVGEAYAIAVGHTDEPATKHGRRHWKPTPQRTARVEKALKAQSAKEWACHDPGDPDIERALLLTPEEALHPKDLPCQAVITDPPYGDTDDDWQPEDLEDFTRDWACEWNECGADFFAVFWSPWTLFEAKRWLDESLTRYRFQQLLITVYANNVPPRSKMRFLNKYEPCLLYRRAGCKTPISPDVGEHFHDVLRAVKPQTNFKDDKFRCHPCQKDVGVFRWLIDALTNPGDLVADPFAGSGSCGIAARQLDRSWYGIESVEEYRDIAMGRLIAYGKDR
jgi:hypothetical protein